MALQKADKADLRGRYFLYVQVGFVLSLTCLIAAFRVNLVPGALVQVIEVDQEIVQMTDILQTRHLVKTPPPPKPPVPIAVPDDELLVDEDLRLDTYLELDKEMTELPTRPSTEAEVEDEPDFFRIVESMPELIGGLGSIQKLINYPEIAMKAGVEGRVYVEFIVDTEGRVVDPVVTRGIGAGCDEEAVRAVSQARFKPGKQRGKAVPVKMSLPITFRLK